MGPPPPSPRIEGQQAQQQAQQQYRATTRGRWPGSDQAAAAVSSAPPISSYASLASGPPPSFAQKTQPTSTSSSSSAAAFATGKGGPPSPRISAESRDFRRPPSPVGGRPMGGGRGIFDGGGGRFDGRGGRSDRGRGGGRFDRGGGRGGGRFDRGGSRGGARGGGGRFSSFTDRDGGFPPSGGPPPPRGSSLSMSGELSTPRTGPGGPPGPGRGGRGGRISDDIVDEMGGGRQGGRFFRRGSGRGDPGSGRFDATSRGGGGRGRGRSYMDGGGRGIRGRGLFRGGRGRFHPDDTHGRDSYNYVDGSNSDGYYNNDSGSYSGDYPEAGPPGGWDYDNNSGRYRRSNSSDGGRSASPRPGANFPYPSRRPSYNETSEFRRSASPGGPLRPGDDASGSYPPSNGDNSTYYPSGGQKRRRDEFPPEPGEEPFKRPLRDPAPQASRASPREWNEEGVSRLPPLRETEGQHKQPLPPPPEEPITGHPRGRGDPRPQDVAPVEPTRAHDVSIAPPASSSGVTKTEGRLSSDQEGRSWASPGPPAPSSFPSHQDRPYSNNIGPSPTKGSPHSSSRNVYNSFDDMGGGDRDFRDGSFRGERGRGRGRGGFRGGRGGRGFEPPLSGRGDYSSRGGDFGGGRGYGGVPPDRRSINAPDDFGRAVGPNPTPRSGVGGSYAQYSDLAAGSGPNWLRDSGSNIAISEEGHRASTSRDWRKPAPPGGPASGGPPVPQPNSRGVSSSYANLACAPPMRGESAAAQKQQQQLRPQSPPKVEEKAKTPPPSPGPPSGVTVAITRLADLEAQMEFAYAKHILLQRRHELLMAQYEHLESLPVGVEAFEEELKKLIGEEKDDKAGSQENDALYGS